MHAHHLNCRNFSHTHVHFLYLGRFSYGFRYAQFPIHSYSGTELQRQVDVTKLLLSFNAFPDISDEYHLTPLHYASFFGPLELVEPLITALRHPDRKPAISHQIINQPTDFGFTPLMYACASGHLQIVAYLVQISHTSTATDNHAALNIAIQYKHVDVVKLLIKFEQQQDKPPKNEAEDHRYLFAIGLPTSKLSFNKNLLGKNLLGELCASWNSKGTCLIYSRSATATKTQL
jgi:ankyrin repeat protein